MAPTRPTRERLPLSRALQIPSDHQLILHEIRTSTRDIKSIDPVTRKLITLDWPVDRQQRVPPSELRDYRQNHRFLGPCCLCPLFVPRGPFAGEYVAQCARGECGYLVMLERIYPKYGVHVNAYPLRDVNEKRPSPVLHHSEMDLDHQLTMSSYSLNRNYNPSSTRKIYYTKGELPGWALALQMPRHQLQPTPARPRTDWRKISKLEQLIRPGLTEEEFINLFVKCAACGLIVTDLVFKYHLCSDGAATDTEDEI